jgi:hypothetical protein
LKVPARLCASDTVDAPATLPVLSVVVENVASGPEKVFLNVSTALKVTLFSLPVLPRLIAAVREGSRPADLLAEGVIRQRTQAASSFPYRTCSQSPITARHSITSLRRR